MPVNVGKLALAGLEIYQGLWYNLISFTKKFLGVLMNDFQQ